MGHVATLPVTVRSLSTPILASGQVSGFSRRSSLGEPLPRSWLGLINRHCACVVQCTQTPTAAAVYSPASQPTFPLACLALYVSPQSSACPSAFLRARIETGFVAHAVPCIKYCVVEVGVLFLAWSTSGGVLPLGVIQL